VRLYKDVTQMLAVSPQKPLRKRQQYRLNSKSNVGETQHRSISASEWHQPYTEVEGFNENVKSSAGSPYANKKEFANGEEAARHIHA